jgi:hypothetical protein
MSAMNHAQLITTMRQMRVLKVLQHQAREQSNGSRRSSLLESRHQNASYAGLLKVLNEEAQALRLDDQEDLATYCFGSSNDRQKHQVRYATLEQRLHERYEDIHTFQPLLVEMFRPTKTGDVASDSVAAVSWNILVDMLSANLSFHLIGNP